MAREMSADPEPTRDLGDADSTDEDYATKSHKRRRVSMDEAEIMARRADPETALEVDIMIMDYQAYKTTSLLFDHDDRTKAEYDESIQSSIIATDAFLVAFRKHHPGYRPDKQLRLRLLLLQFGTLYARRYSSDESTPTPAELEILRNERVIRVRRWISSPARVPSNDYDVSLVEAMPPLSHADLSLYRKHVLRMLQPDIGEVSEHYGSQESLSLLDLLPKFMELCAITLQQDHSTPRASLLRLMSEFMLQASLEQYLVYGAGNTIDPVDEAFAWGCFADVEDEDMEEDEEMSEVIRKSGNEQSGADGSDEIKATMEVSDQQPISMLPTNHSVSKAFPHDRSASTASSHDNIASDSGASTSSQSGNSSIVGITSPIDNPQSLSELEKAIDNMFRDDATGQESMIWIDAKAYALDELLLKLDRAISVPEHLANVASLYTVQDFDARLRSFLLQCSSLLDLPILEQIERGRLQGMSQNETRVFLGQCGLTTPVRST